MLAGGHTFYESLNYGSVPDWLSAFGTIIAVLGLWREVRISREQRRESDLRASAAEAAQSRLSREEQARNVSGWVEEAEGTVDLRNYAPVVSNASRSAIYNVRLELVGVDDVQMREFRVVPPESMQKGAAWLAIRLAADEAPIVRLSFTDSSGVSWIRIGSDLREASVS